MKEIFVILAIALVIAPVASAVDTEIYVKTFPFYEVSAIVMADSDVYQLLDIISGESASNGQVTLVYSGPEESFKINIQISRNDEKVLLEKFGERDAGGPLYFQVIPGNISDNYLALESNKTNVTDENSGIANLTNESGGVGGVITGQAVDNAGESGVINSRVMYISLGVLFILIAIFLLVARFTPVFKKDPAYSYKAIKPEMKEHQPEKPQRRVENVDDELNEAERKIKEAQETINILKNRKKIEEVEGKIEEYKGLLEQLKKEKNPGN